MPSGIRMGERPWGMAVSWGSSGSSCRQVEAVFWAIGRHWCGSTVIGMDSITGCIVELQRARKREGKFLNRGTNPNRITGLLDFKVDLASCKKRSQELLVCFPVNRIPVPKQLKHSEALALRFCLQGLSSPLLHRLLDLRVTAPRPAGALLSCP